MLEPNQFIKGQTPFEPSQRNMYVYVGHRFEFVKSWNSGNILNTRNILSPENWIVNIGNWKIPISRKSTFKYLSDELL